MMAVRSRVTWHGDAVIATIDAAAWAPDQVRCLPCVQATAQQVPRDLCSPRPPWRYPMKITIRRRSDGWHVTRPAVGLGPDTVTVYPTGRAALRSLNRSGPGLGLAELQIAGYEPGIHQQFRPRWIDLGSHR